jgi:hypothetical protein
MTEESYNRKNIKVLKVGPKFILGKCWCGCNKDISIRTSAGILRKYILGHHLCGKPAINYKGETNSGPYKVLYRPNHPFKDKRGYVLKHRLIYEHYLKIIFDEDIYIPKNIEIHHIIPVDKGGTNALINLTCMTRSEHRRHHNLEDMSDRFCSICGSDKTRMIKLDDLIRPKWFGNKEKGFKCAKCYGAIRYCAIKERIAQKRHERMKDPIYRSKYNEHNRQYKKRRRLLKRLEINTLDKYSD